MRGAAKIVAGAGVILALASCSRGPEPARPMRPADINACFRQLERMPNLKWQRVPDRAASPGCGWRQAVQVTSVSGVALKGAGPMTCPVAAGLARWVDQSVKPEALRRYGVPIVEIGSMGTYSCRGRNNQRGAVLSEHSSANAIDVSIFRMADGRRATVIRNWDGDDKPARRFLREVAEGACKTFNLVLTPESDANHRDHLHLDMGRWGRCG
jgi:hypothetical protein